MAFLLSSNEPVVRIELGPARPIDAAVNQWRSEIQEKRSSQAQHLRELVWEPIERNLPPGIGTVYTIPDGTLAGLPWAALPGSSEGSVLLEQYAFATVPFGQFLLDELANPPPSADSGETLLTVGDVNYDQRSQARAPSSTVLTVTGSAARGEKQHNWPGLPGTRRELDALSALRDNRQIISLRGAEATTDRVLAELPHARWAHLASHGFFADPKFRSAFQLDEDEFEPHRFKFVGERTTTAGRNPLVLSGLVLAGANLPQQTDDLGLPQGDGGILTAEAIAGLYLRNLQLAVLSACETGLGDVAGGEGVMGLTRAFHLAGTRNVSGEPLEGRRPGHGRPDESPSITNCGPRRNHLWTRCARPS